MRRAAPITNARRQVLWASHIERPETAPRDGSKFMGIRKGSFEAEPMCWDDDMGCFLTDDFALVDRLSGWLVSDAGLAALGRFLAKREG
jgi:hypothetical protein